MKRLLPTAVLLGWALSGSAAIQPSTGAVEEPRQALFLREEEDLTHALALAEGLGKASDWAGAAPQLLKVLAAEEDLLVPVSEEGTVLPEGNRRYLGARTRALDLYRSWAPEGREAVRALCAVPAQALWERCGNDPAVLEELAHRFPVAPEGALALDRLGDLRLEEGHPARAAACWAAASRLHPGHPRGASWASKLRDAEGRMRPPAPPRPAPWPPALSEGPRPGLPVWRVPFDPSAEGAVEVFRARGLPPPLPYAPLAADGWVLLSGPGGVTAYDAASGRVRWTSGEAPALSGQEGPWTPALSCGLCLAVGQGRLAAYELSGGRKRWETPAELQVVTPPCVEGSLVLVGVLEASGSKVNFDARAYRVEDGSLLWSRHLTSMFDRASLGEGPRGAVACAGGRAVFSSDLGCLAAFGVTDGAPLWLLRYESHRESDRRRAARTGDRWDPNPLLLSGGALLAAPRDADDLICLSVEDGRVRWRMARQGATRLLASDAFRVYLSGPSSARAVSLDDGHPLWEHLAEFSGRGYLGQDGLVLPGTRGPRLLDPADGRLLHADRWPEGAAFTANLVPGGGLVLACGGGALWALEPASVSRGRQDPLARARLALQAGDGRSALDCLGPAAGGESDALRAQAFRCLGEAAEAAGDGRAAGAAYAQAARLLPEGDEGPALWLRSGDCLERAGDPAGAVASYQALLARPSERAVPWAFGRIRADWAARLSVQGILDRCGPAPYAAFDQEASARLKDLPPGRERQALSELVARYPNSAAAREAERRLAPGASAPSPPRLLWRLKLGSLWEVPPSAGRPFVVEDDGRFLFVDPATGAASPLPVPPHPQSEWAWLPDGFAAAEGDAVRAFDPAGKPRWEARLKEPVGGLFLAGNRLLAVSATGLFVIDPADGKILGRPSSRIQVSAPPLRAGGLILVASGADPRHPARVSWLDAESGKPRATLDLGEGAVTQFLACPESGEALLLLASRRVLALPLEPEGNPKVLWEHAAPGPQVASLLAGAGKVFLLPDLKAPGAQLKALESGTGRLAWKAPSGSMGIRSAVLSGGLLVGAYASGAESGASAWDPETGRLRWREGAWGRPVEAFALPLPSGVLLWAEGSEEAVLLDPATGSTVRRYAFPADPAVQVLPCGDGFLWAGTRFLAGLAPASDFEVLQGLWARRAPAPDPRARLAQADALFRAGAYRRAVSALREALRGGEGLEAESEARVQAWLEHREASEPTLVLARRARAAPEIDGELRDGWPEHLSVDSGGPIDLERFLEEGWEGEADLGSRLYVAWDDDYLYIAADVEDQSQVVYDEQVEGRGDFIYFTVDARGDGRDLFNAGLAIQNPRARPPDPGSLPPGEYAAKRRADNTGTVYEAAIPWSGLHQAGPQKDLLLRLNFLVGDDDGRGILKVLRLGPGLPARMFLPQGPRQRVAPELFPRIKLID